MKHWSLVHVLALGAAYVVVILGSTIAWAHYTNAIKRGPNGAWQFFWLIPYSTVRTYSILVILPPTLLFVTWLVVRRTG